MRRRSGLHVEVRRLVELLAEVPECVMYIYIYIYIYIHIYIHRERERDRTVHGYPKLDAVCVCVWLWQTVWYVWHLCSKQTRWS